MSIKCADWQAAYFHVPQLDAFCRSCDHPIAIVGGRDVPDGALGAITDAIVNETMQGAIRSCFNSCTDSTCGPMQEVVVGYH